MVIRRKNSVQDRIREAAESQKKVKIIKPPENMGKKYEGAYMLLFPDIESLNEFITLHIHNMFSANYIDNSLKLADYLHPHYKILPLYEEFIADLTKKPKKSTQGFTPHGTASWVTDD